MVVQATHRLHTKTPHTHAASSLPPLLFSTRTRLAAHTLSLLAHTPTRLLVHTQSMFAHTQSLLAHIQSLLAHTQSLLAHIQSLLAHKQSLLPLHPTPQIYIHTLPPSRQTHTCRLTHRPAPPLWCFMWWIPAHPPTHIHTQHTYPHLHTHTQSTNTHTHLLAHT